MKKASLNFAIGLFLLVFAASLAWAQRGGRIHYSNLFNPQTMGTVSGEVVRVDYVLSGNGRHYCTQALLKTPRGNITAVLGPKSFMEEQGLTIAAKDRVTVTGSRIAIMNRPFILVTKVTGDRTMKLREASGRPVWADGADWHAR